MNINKITIIGTIIAIILIITVPTVYKVIKNHNDNLLHAVEEKIIQAAKKCYYEEKCKEKKITLKNLYDLEYLDKISNPISKEYYNENSYVIFNNNKFKFVVQE